MKYQNKQLIETSVLSVLLIFLSGSFFILITPFLYENQEQLGSLYNLWLLFPIFVVGSVCVWVIFRVRHAEKIQKKINKYS